MAFQEDDPAAVSQADEIQSIVQAMLSRRALVRLDVPGQAVALISTLLNLDLRSGTLWLDNALEDHTNALFLQAPAVRMQSQMDGTQIEFSGPLRLAMQAGEPAFAMRLPKQIRRWQRRESFRVTVPADNPARCEILHASLPAGRSGFPLRDISTGGLSLLDRDQGLADMAIGTPLHSCRLILPEIAELTVSMQLVRTALPLRENDSPARLVALRYLDLAASQQITIQQYIGGLERAILARRWGSG